jgi:hypothetical protein
LAIPRNGNRGVDVGNWKHRSILALKLLDRLRRSPDEPVLRPMSAFAFVLGSIILGFLAYEAWWRIALFGLGVLTAIAALVFREMSGTPTGSESAEITAQPKISAD